MRKKKIKRLKVLYAIFFFVLFLELLGSLGAIFFGDSAIIKDAGMTNTFLVIVTAIVILIPMTIESKYDVDVPDFLEVLLLVMLFIGVVLGFLNNYYVDVKNFDKFTHTLSGITLSVIAFQALYVLNGSKNIALKMEPFIMSVFAYTLSITLLVIWEFYEFIADVVSYNLDNDTLRNMQRYQWVSDSLIFPQDYGLYDTMIDLFVGSIGSLIVIVCGYLLIRHNKLLTK